MHELLIRPGRPDAELIADLLAPTSVGAAERLFGSLVLDASVAAREPQFGVSARERDLPLLIDPCTFLWQDEIRSDDPWIKHVPFAKAEVLTPRDVMRPERRERIVASVVEFELKHGATAIIPPYFFVSGPDDPAFSATIGLIGATARHLRRLSLPLPIVPVFCGQHQGFAMPQSWKRGINEFATAAIEVGPQFLGFSLSPTGSADDGYNKVLRLLQAALQLRSFGAPVVGWRQGVYGPALVASGLDGYETGIGTRERSDIRSMISARRPSRSGKRSSGGAVQGVYLQPLGRSVRNAVAEALLGDRSMRARLICDDSSCCPNGVLSMLDHRGNHAVRSRSRQLAELAAMPHRAVRLHRMSVDARDGAHLARKASEILRRERLGKISADGLDSLAEALVTIRQLDEVTAHGEDETKN